MELISLYILIIFMVMWFSRGFAGAIGVSAPIYGENVAGKWNNRMTDPLFEGVLDAMAGCGKCRRENVGRGEKKCQEQVPEDWTPGEADSL